MLSELEINEIVKNAQEKSDIARRAIDDCLSYTKQIKHEQDNILERNKILSEDFETDLPSLKSRLDNDLKIAETINNSLSSYKVGVDVSWAIKTHKMQEILTGAQNLLNDEENAYKISIGKIPTSYDNSIGFDKIPILGYQESTIYGNSKCSYLSAAVIESYLNLLGKSSKISDINLFGNKTPWFDKSAITHFDYLPKDAVIPNFDSFSFMHNDSNKFGLVYVHSGYAFGGVRGSELNPYVDNGKKFIPYDCSSWAASIVGSNYSYSTYHLLEAFNTKKQVGFVSQKEQHIVNEALDKIEPVEVNNIQQVEPGMLMCFRKFNEKNSFENSLGTSGHVAMALGTSSSGEVVSIGYNRDMPNIEGFGIQAFPIINDDSRKTMFFRVKPNTENNNSEQKVDETIELLSKLNKF